MPGSVPWRIGLLAGAAVAGVLTVTDGVARLAARSPAAFARAQAVAPRDPAVQTALAERALVRGPAPAALAQASAHARAALSADITRVDAMAVLGTAAEMRGERQSARAIMTASDALSRRDTVTRMWFINDAVRRGTTAGALDHFDVALRTSVTAHRALFPILASAMQDDRLVRPMIRLLRRQPAWAGDFLYTAIATNRATRNIAAVYAALDPKPVHASGDDLGQLLIDTLVAQRDYAGAWSLDRALTSGGGGGALLVDPGFASAAGRAPFTWQLTATADFDAARASDPMGRPGLAVLSTGSARGVVAEQLLALPPGRYTFANRAGSEQPEPRAIPRWTLSCAEGGRALGTLLPASQATATWTVPAGCRFQWLRLAMDAGDTITSEDWFVRPVSLTRAR